LVFANDVNLLDESTSTMKKNPGIRFDAS